MKTELIFIQGLKREVTFYVGQNQNENFEVIDKGNSQDIWFHAKNVSSCHVVCKLPDDINKKEISYIIKIGCALCKSTTNKLKGLKNVEIIYTKLKNITKTDVNGCVVAKDTKTITC